VTVGYTPGDIEGNSNGYDINAGPIGAEGGVGEDGAVYNGYSVGFGGGGSLTQNTTTTETIERPVKSLIERLRDLFRR